MSADATTPPELADAQAAFARGDFRGARAAARRALTGEAGPTPEVRAAAEELLARLAPDPWARRWAWLTLVTLALVCWQYFH